MLLRGENLLEQDEARLTALRGKELALALSNPRQHLNPILTIGRHLSDVIRAHRPMRHAASLAAAVELLKSVNIPDPVLRLQAYPHELSGGMCQRVILALAIANAPRLLIVDEPTNGLDVTVSVQILDLMRDAVRKLNSGLLLVSRDLGVVANYCERVVVMNAGRVVEEAEVRKFFATPQNVYSRKLLHAAAAARDADLASSGTSPVLFRTEPRPEIPLPATSGPLLEVRNLVKRFPVRDGRVLNGGQRRLVRHRPRRGRWARRRERLGQDDRRPLCLAADRADLRLAPFQWAGDPQVNRHRVAEAACQAADGLPGSLRQSGPSPEP